LHQWDSHMYFHVCAGLGSSPYTPVRFGCRPEASLLTLVPRSA
ncbi:MAG: metallophosphoesterase, partial [Jatrophihabitans sp.]|nr:metallophosphoesterase [Jatrophihabitans sp.]